MDFSKEYNDLARIVVDKFRDENYSNYLKYKSLCLEISKDEFEKRIKNLAKDLAIIEKERFEFFNSLSIKQNNALDKLILNNFDDTAFNVLREIEENLEKTESIGLTINGKAIEEITKEFLSGTCFGEYFLWLKQNSKYGNYQH